MLYEVCLESKDLDVSTLYKFLIFISDAVNELPLRNYFSA
jgi:hypothetical protein